ncbi:hypothetical protein MKW98_029678 [Papaver atlanticum]|uniref:Uncharacterized protein n=1 Tax=Papaver atlanticum TaxID=357466 RepID=A0AAD4T7T0_9MAGN|nr:hypothetical protein MKW98_029678 [Papaver atlanticum]
MFSLCNFSKKLIKRVQCRIKLSKNKRYSIITQLREDIIQLLKSGLDRSAFARVGQLSKDQNIVAAYELLDHFCEFIIMNLPYIRRNRDCPNDINEAASSLLYASARCGDLPELPKLRKLFGDRYGNRFAIAAVELLPGNLVNRQLIKYLSIESISVDVKFRLMKEIARENCLEMDHLQTDIKCWQQSNDVDEFYSAIGDFHWDLQNSDPDICIGLQDVKQVETRESTKFDAVLSDSRELVIATKVDRTNFEALPSDSRELVIASKVDIPEKLDTMGELEVVFQDRITSQRNSGICSTPSKVSNSSVPNKIEALTVVTTSEGSFQISDKNIVYLDDVEEFEPSIQVDGNFKELRLFMFKLTHVPPGKECTEQDKFFAHSNRASLSDLFLGLDDDRMEKPVSSDGKTSSRSSTRRRRSKRRHLYMENQMSQTPTSVCSSIKDIEYAFYYNGSWHNRRKNQKSMLVGDRGSFSFNGDEIKSQQWCGELRSPEEIRFEDMEENFQSHKWKCQRRAKSICGCNCAIAAECSLYHPCYFVTSHVNDDWGSPASTQTSESTKLLECPNGKTGSVSHFKKLRVKRDCNRIQLMKGATVPQIQHEEVIEKLAPVGQENYASSRESCTRETSPWKNKNVRPPYLKDMILPPPQKQKATPTDQFIRSAVSFQYQQRASTSNNTSSSSCSHIHPKLPDYDDLEARFLVIKKEHSGSSISLN